jgi:hypothetical protein
MESKFENNLKAFTEHVKMVKKLAKGKAPAKGPGYFSSDAVVQGRDGNQWKTARVYHVDTSDGYLDEQYELVWVPAF